MANEGPALGGRAGATDWSHRIIESCCQRSSLAPMEEVIFCRIQPFGKTTSYFERFFDTHVGTDPIAAERTRYIVSAIAAGFRVVGYFFASRLRRP